jgi:CBS domain-containing protein
MVTTTVGKLLQTKTASHVLTIGPDVIAYEALELMAVKDVGALVVLENGRVVGVFSERDYARKVILKGKSSKVAHVRELMSTHVLYATPDQDLEDCMALMTAKRVRHLPVLDNGQLIGIISIGDVVKKIISDQKRELRDLEKYISGTGY